MERVERPLIVIVGPTASGKTALAISLASQFNGEIISADSRAIYKGMDIGAAKPSVDERQGVPHWGFDIVSPGDRFTVADFKVYALRKIDEIRMRGKVPFIVGGTGLYIDALLFDYQFGSDGDAVVRKHMNTKSVQDLQEYCRDNNIIVPENERNRRYLIRAIEQKGVNSLRKPVPIHNSVIVGIATDRRELRTRISLRSEHILNSGVVEEATLLGGKYGWDNEAMTGNVYPFIRRYIAGELMTDDIQEKFTVSDWRLAKRQMTWFRRNPHIYWGNRDELRSYVSARLLP